DAGAAEDHPTGAVVGVIDGDAGTRIGDGRDVGDRAAAAPGVGLPARLGNESAAAAAGAAPDHLAPAAATAGIAREARAARGGDGGQGGRELAVAVAAVAGAGGDGVAGMVEMSVSETDLAGPLAAAVAVTDGVGAEDRRAVDRRAQVVEGVGVG